MRVFKYITFLFLLFQVHCSYANNEQYKKCENDVLKALKDIDLNSAGVDEIKELIKLRSDMALAKTGIALFHLKNNPQKVEELKNQFKSSNNKYTKSDLSKGLEKYLGYINEKESEIYNKANNDEYGGDYIYDLLSPASKKFEANSKYHVNKVDSFFLNKALTHFSGNNSLFSYTLKQMRLHMPQRDFIKNDFGAMKSDYNKKMKAYKQKLADVIYNHMDTAKLLETENCKGIFKNGKGERCIENLDFFLTENLDNLEEQLTNIISSSKEQDDLLTLKASEDRNKDRSIFLHVAAPVAQIECRITGTKESPKVSISGDFTNISGFTKNIWSINEVGSPTQKDPVSSIALPGQKGKVKFNQSFEISLKNNTSKFLQFRSKHHPNPPSFYLQVKPGGLKTSNHFAINQCNGYKQIFGSAPTPTPAPTPEVQVETQTPTPTDPVTTTPKPEVTTPAPVPTTTPTPTTPSTNKPEEEQTNPPAEAEGETNRSKIRLRAKGLEKEVEIKVVGDKKLKGEDIEGCQFSTCNSADAEYEDGKDEDDDDAVSCVVKDGPKAKFKRRVGESYYVYLFCDGELQESNGRALRKVIGECDSVECLEEENQNMTPMGPPMPGPSPQMPDMPEPTTTIKRL